MARGCLISFEGIDGCGKSTQIRFLSKALEERGIDFLCLREPGGTELGEAIRALLLEKTKIAFSAQAELLLFCAARAQLIQEKIQPALEAGRWVLCDRFIHSTLAYQGGARGLGIEKIRPVLDFACQGMRPDATFWIDVDLNEAAKRLSRRKGGPDRMEAEGLAFMKQVREAYAELERVDSRLHRIEGSWGKLAQHELVMKTLRLL